MRLMTSLMLAAALLMSLPAMATHAYQLEHVRIGHPFATPAPPGVSHAAAYVDLVVEGDEPVVLVGARSPASETIELHNMAMEGGMMRMRQVTQIAVQAGRTQTMRPGGGYHLMLMNLVAPLREGDRFPLTLTFAEIGEIEVEVRVQSGQRGSEEADALLYGN
jgi:periplasmic copper chaperone A